MIFLLAYLWFTDELHFAGFKTEIATATVTRVMLKPFRGGYFEEVKYEFKYKDQQYSGIFRGSKFTGHHAVGDQLKVKFRVNNPSISKRLITYKRR